MGWKKKLSAKCKVMVVEANQNQVPSFKTLTQFFPRNFHEHRTILGPLALKKDLGAKHG